MDQPTRSPFGQLLYRYRRERGMSQRDLANLTFQLASGDANVVPVSERTISSLEHPASSGESRRRPHLSTTRSLALALGLTPGTPSCDAFLAASQQDGTHHAGTSPTATQDHGGPLATFFDAGRQPHLAQVSAAIDAAAGGAAQVALVGADPGTGKTTLVAEACRRGLNRHPHLVVLWTQCASLFGTGPSYEPFRAMLGVMAGDFATASEREMLSVRNAATLAERVPATTRALLTEGLELLGSLLPASALGNERLATTVDDDTRAALLRAAEQDVPGTDVSDAIFRVLTRYSESGPVVLVLEDLHWADAGTRLVLAHLVSRLAGHRLPLAIIGTYRPGELARATDTKAPTLDQVLRMMPRRFPNGVVDLSTAIGGASGRAFVNAAVARANLHDADTLATRLFELTSGVPLFVMSLLRLYEQDASRRGSAPGDTPGMSLPAEVETVFAEQLQRLPHEVRDLLTAASVQGNAFIAETLMRVLNLTRAEFIEMVDNRLVRQFRMLLPDTPVTIADQQVHRYAFSHALLRDYLYASMTALQRAHYHGLTAEAMLALYGDAPNEATAEIAFHFDESGERRKAANAHLRAGDFAMDRREFEAATRHFQRLEELGTRTWEPELFIHSVIGHAHVARWTGKPRESRTLLHQAEQLAGYHQLPLVQTQVTESLAMLDFDTGRMRQGVERLRTVVETRLAADHPGTARSMVNLSYLLYGLGRYEDAMTFARRAGPLADARGDVWTSVSAMLALGNCLLDLGDYETALATYRSCIATSEARGIAHIERLSLLNTALANIELERWEDAQDAIDRVTVSAAERASRLAGMVELYRGLLAEGRGARDKAAHHYASSMHIRETSGEEALLIDALAGLLRIATADEDRDRARELMEDIAQRIDRRGVDGIEHVGRLFLALVDASEAFGASENSRRWLDSAVRFLTERASLLTSDAHRESYLGNPPAHRRIMTLAAERGVSTASGDANG